MEEQRFRAIENIFRAFNKPARPEVVTLVCERTNGIDTVKFFAVCREIEGYNEFPTNLFKEMVRMAGTESKGVECCPKCCVYIDGKIDMFEDGVPHHYAPGLQHRTNTDSGAHYTTPCTCAAGRAIRDKAGMGPEPAQRPEREVDREWW